MADIEFQDVVGRIEDKAERLRDAQDTTPIPADDPRFADALRQAQSMAQWRALRLKP